MNVTPIVASFVNAPIFSLRMIKLNKMAKGQKFKRIFDDAYFSGTKKYNSISLSSENK